jgi:hypothetical protein
MVGQPINYELEMAGKEAGLYSLGVGVGVPSPSAGNIFVLST